MAIEDPDDQAALYPDHAAGTVDFSWFSLRQAGKATLSGQFCFVTHSQSVAVLRAHLSPADFGLDGADFDSALLKDSEARALTRSIARWLYDQEDAVSGGPLVDGVEFRSRHGDDLRAWAVFERADDGDVSPHFTNVISVELSPYLDPLRQALQLHGLSLI